MRRVQYVTSETTNRLRNDDRHSNRNIRDETGVQQSVSAAALLALSIMQGEVAFDLRSCWDCAVSRANVAVQTVLLAVIFSLGVYLAHHRREGLAAIGGALMGLALIVSFAFAMSVPNWGVVKSNNPLAFYDRSMVRTFYWSIVAIECTSILAVAARKRRRRNTRQTAEQR